MVQRKVIDKLGIQFQAGGDKSEKRLQQQDFKKKMKKSGSMKRQDFEKSRLPSKERKEHHPGKPPPPTPSLSTPEKQPGGGAGVELSTPTPNYMKSTSSSEARKEKPQVSSSRNSKTSPESINSRRKSSISSSSRILSRVLTKTPSFKPARSSAKKCSPIVLCENLDVKRSTCSSTLKDYKFPTCLSLNPGGTESEGTSVMKVCPYNYCSLNGHKHDTVPPLKKLLSARRLMIKTQKGLKLGCLSPRRPKVNPLVEKDDDDTFFVEIYGVEKEDGVDHQSKSQSTMTDILPSIDAEEIVAVEEETKLGCLWDPLEPEIMSENEQGVQSDEVGSDILASVDSKDEKEEESENHTEEIVAAEEETKLECSWGPPEIDEQGVQSDEVGSDVSDMDWEAGEYSAFYLDYDDEDDSLKGVKENNCEGGDSFDINSRTIHEENVSKCFDEISAEEGSWSSESTEYLEKLKIEITSFLFEDQMRKLNESKEDKNDVVFSDPENDEEPNIEMLQDNVLPDNRDEKHEENVGKPDSSKEHQSDAAKIHPPDQSDITNEESEMGNAENQGHSRCKRSIDESDEESRKFNPRGPNFLELEPDPEAEKVDLKHQMVDERKNAEEWMLDYALRRAVTTLAPARKRKVALLVEAFEKVLPCEPHRAPSSSTLGHARPIQACR